MGSSGRSRSSAIVSEDAPGTEHGSCRLGRHLAALPRKVAEVGPLLEDVVGLSQDCPGAGRTASANTRPSRQSTGRDNGKRVVEQWPQSGSSCDELSCLRRISPLHGTGLPTRTRGRSSTSRRTDRPASVPGASRANDPAAVQSSRSIAAMPRSASTTGANGSAPTCAAASTARAKIASARSGQPQEMRDALRVQHRGPIRAGRTETVQATRASWSHLGESVAQTHAARRRQPCPRSCCHQRSVRRRASLRRRQRNAQASAIDPPTRTSTLREPRSPGSARPGGWPRTTPSIE